MRTIKKVISAVTASALSLTMAASSMVGSLPVTVTAADKSAIEIVDDMGLGWNLGNTFDAWNVTWTKETWTGWGNDMPSADLFKALKASGISSVRIPITWYQHTDSSTFDIEDDYLARIKTVVDYAREADMYVIINMHWDWESKGSLWLNKGLDALPQFNAMWKEIANYFKSYDEHLVFEDMNEVAWQSNIYGPYTDDSYNTLNKLNSEFVSNVRATGGNNANRLLLLAGANTDLDNTCNSKFVVPNDKMVAVSIHYYRPSTFTVAEPGASYGYSSTWGSTAEVNAVYNDFSRMKSTFVDKGVPVILGESGVANAGKFNRDKESIRKFIKTVDSTAMNTSGITAFLWDDSGHGDLNYFNRNTLEWFDPEIGNIIHEVSGGTGEGPTYQTKNRVTLKFKDLETDEGGYVIDLTPYGAQDATLTSVIINGAVKGGDFVGYGLGFEAAKDGTAGSWCSETVQLTSSDTSASAALDGKGEDDKGNTYAYELAMKYLQVQQWWADGDATCDLDSITLVFDKEISVVDTGEEDPTDPDPTEPVTDPATDPATEPTTEPVTVEPKDWDVWAGYQYAGNKLGKKYGVMVDGSGTYTIEIPEVGTTMAGDMILYLDSKINIYDYAINEESDGLKDGTLDIKIDSIKVDGKEITYTPSKNCVTTDDKGQNLRINIVNPYFGDGIEDIDPNITVEEGMSITFTIKMDKEGSTGDISYGDVDCDGKVGILDVITLNKNLMVNEAITDEGRKNADVDNSGSIDEVDALNILKAVVELTTLPV